MACCTQMCMHQPQPPHSRLEVHEQLLAGHTKSMTFCAYDLTRYGVLQGDAVEDLLPSSSSQELPHANEYAPESSQQAGTSPAASGSAQRQEGRAGQLQQMQQVDMSPALGLWMIAPSSEIEWTMLACLLVSLLAGFILLLHCNCDGLERSSILKAFFALLRKTA